MTAGLRSRRGRGARVAAVAATALGVWLTACGLWAPPSTAATSGAPLTLPANESEGCEALVAPSLRSYVGVPSSCVFFGSDPGGAWTSQAPSGSWVITRASVRAGSRVGPMAFVVLQAMRSQATPANPPTAPGTPVVGGLICCTVTAESKAFTPTPNTVTEVPVSLPAVNTVENLEGEPVEVVDYLGIAVLNLESSLPIHLAAAGQPGATSVSSYLIPKATGGVSVGEEILIEGAEQGWTPLVAGDFQAPPTAPTAPVAPAPPVAPTAPAPTTPAAPPTTSAPANAFTILPHVKLLGRGTRARVRVHLPGPGLLQATAPAARAKPARAAVSRRHRRGRRTAGRKHRVLLAAFHRHEPAGTATILLRLTRAGRRRLAHHRKLKVRVKLTFTPDGGSPASRTRTLTFRRHPQRRKRHRSPSRRSRAGR